MEYLPCRRRQSFGTGTNRLSACFCLHVYFTIKIPFCESVPPGRSAPQCGPPCPPGARIFGPGHSCHQEAAVSAGTVLVGSCARSQSRPDTQRPAGEGQSRHAAHVDWISAFQCAFFFFFFFLNKSTMQTWLVNQRSIELVHQSF